MNFLNSIRRKSASPASKKKSRASQSPVTASPKKPKRTKSEQRAKEKADRQEREADARRRPRKSEKKRHWLTPEYRRLKDAPKRDHEEAEAFLDHYANLGPEGIRAEFLKEVGDYRSPNTAHTWFDAFPDKNRDNDVATCLDANRVQLSDKKAYINASRAPNFKHDGRGYIITQIPLDSTMNDFWEMMFQHKIACAVILVDKLTPDPPETPFAKFWPVELDEVKVYGNITITCVEKYVETKKDRLRHVLELERKGDRDEWTMVFYTRSSAVFSPPYSYKAIDAALSLCYFIDTLEYELEKQNLTILTMDEHGGTTHASLLVLLDSLSEHIHSFGQLVPEMMKWALGIRGGAKLGEEEYLMCVRFVTEFTWRCIGDKEKHGERYQKIMDREPKPREK